MEFRVGNNFTWVIKNFSFLQSEYIYSHRFVIDGCKWRLMALPQGTKIEKLSIYLVVADYRSLPCGWRRHAKFRLTILNQCMKNLPLVKERYELFNQKTPASGFMSMFPLGHAEVYGGFLMYDEINIVVELDVLEVIGKSDFTSKEYDDARDAVYGSLLNKASPSSNANGFQVLPSQMDLVRRIFERHPDIVIGTSFKDQHTMKTCMSNFLSLINTLCQSPRGLCNEDMVEAERAYVYVYHSAGFDVRWLWKKFDQISKKKKEEKFGAIRVRELEEDSNFLKQKCSEMKALLDKEKTKVLAAKAPLTLDDVIGKLDFSEECQNVIQPPLKKIKRKDDHALCFDLNADASSDEESIDVDGFQPLPSHQVDFVRRFLEKHSEIALELCPKNPYLRKAYISLLTSLIEKLCQSPKELSKEDLSGAEYAITYVKELGLKVDWLKEKVEEVKEKKKQVESGESQVQELEKELKEFNERCSDMRDLLEKEKAKVLAARAPFTLDEVFLMT